VIPEGADRAALGWRMARLLFADPDSWVCDAVLDSDDVGVYDPETHVPVPCDLLRRMAVVCTYGGPFTDDEAELIERWSE